MYHKSAAVYDAIYLEFKDYAKEASLLKQIIHQHLRSGGNALLDVACGTGLHLSYLVQDFQAEGIDISAEMIAVARRRLPEIPLHVGDMTDFSLPNRFDVITCMFSSIGYVGTPERLKQAIACMGAHLKPGGLLLVEPWITPEAWKTHLVHMQTVDRPELKVTRMNISMQKGRLSIMDMHHLVGTPEGVEHFVEHHELALFTRDEMLDAFQAAALDTRYDPEGIFGRGLYIAGKALDTQNPSTPK